MPERITETYSLFETASEFVLHTSRPVFLTGKAGTGKTTFLKHIKEKSAKKTVIVAPTGVAAINAGGVTLHSFFQLPMGSFLPGRHHGFSTGPSYGTDLNTLLRNLRFNREKRRILEELELLIIDEVSMLRADMLDAIDGILRHIRKRPDEAFGGVQMLYIGDMYQLPPVVSNEEWSKLSAYYNSMFFFDALVLKEAMPVYIELQKIYRQTDDAFIRILNNIRNNEATEEDLALLNKKYDPYFHPDAEDGYIILTSHNYKADKINQGALARLAADAFVFEGNCSGDFNENALPVEKALALKVGAQVMFIRNDKGDQRRYYNGKIGYISRIRNEEIFVRFAGQREELQLEKETWRNVRYKYNEEGDHIEEEEVGSYKQYPIRLAWAVTIHKSQGLTFEKAIIDAGQSFAAGQVYVALSRLISLSGLVLGSPITPAAIHTDDRITAFSRSWDSGPGLQQQLKQEQELFIGMKLMDSFNWRTVSEAFQANHREYQERSIPSQEEALIWSLDMLKKIVALKDTGDKFIGQLRQLMHDTNPDRHAIVQQRVAAASRYFSEQLEGSIIPALKQHQELMKIKAKVKKYMKSLELLRQALDKKKHQMEQAVTLANGLATGASAASLLEQHLNAPKLTVKTGSTVETTSGIKEESKAISLAMLREGTGIDAIAAERGLARSTVEAHLVFYLQTGEVTLDQVVSAENQEAIRKAVLHSKETDVAVIRRALGNTFSYAEVRAVILQMEKDGTLPAANKPAEAKGNNWSVK